MAELLCPVCGRSLVRGERTYACAAKHSYDLAKQGYVNLLPPSDSRKRHGDDKLMVRARSEFLDAGFYDPLSNEIASLSCALTGRTPDLLDAGCGEGKYTVDVLNALRAAGKQPSIVGVDISKEALMRAGRRSKELTLCAASLAKLPLAGESIDLIIDIFAPFMREEFLRVLRPGGHLLWAYPLEKHLWELKELIYDKPYENPPMALRQDGFRLTETKNVCFEMELTSGEQIQNLFCMTPYYYKTGAEDQKKASAARSLTVRAEFGIAVYEKE